MESGGPVGRESQLVSRAVAEGAKGSRTGSRLWGSRASRAWTLLRVGVRVTTGLE